MSVRNFAFYINSILVSGIKIETKDNFTEVVLFVQTKDRETILDVLTKAKVSHGSNLNDEMITLTMSSSYAYVTGFFKRNLGVELSWESVAAENVYETS